MWLWWVLGGLVAWFLIALVLGVVIGRAARMADERELGLTPDVVVTGNVVAAEAPAPHTRRRAIPLPPVGVALAALAVALEGTGFLLRQTGATGTVARVLSMDAPASIPRLYVATLFAFAALVGLAGAGVVPGRRTWWTVVGLVGVGIAVIKYGGTWHAWALNWVADRVGPVGAFLASALVAVAVVGGLFFLSRTERRDRRRVLGSLAGYAVAAVGLSALSQIAPAQWIAAATFVEESGEALAGVAFLIAVLAGVAPRAVLPAGWPLRRAADAQTLELAQPRPGRASEAQG